MLLRFLWLLPLLLFISILLVCWRGLFLTPQILPSNLINQFVPTFNLPELFSPHKTFSSAQLKGKITLLNVWASWCANCRLEHPVLIDIAKNQKIPIYGIDYKDQRLQAIHWLKETGNPYRAIGDDAQGNAAINLGVYGTPETFIIDATGKIRYKHIGPITADVWQEEILPKIHQLRQNTLQDLPH